MESDRHLEAIWNLQFQDPLTGLFNQQFFRRAFPELAAKAACARTPLGLILIRIDGLRRRGRRAEDAILPRVGAIFDETVSTDLHPVHLCDDEFVVLARGLPLTRCTDVADALSEKLRTERFPVVGSAETLQLEVHAAVSHYPAHTDDPTTLLDRAVAALRRRGERPGDG